MERGGGGVDRRDRSREINFDRERDRTLKEVVMVDEKKCAEREEREEKEWDLS